MPEWGFYGRRDELKSLQTVFGRDRWFFVKITGRRRIGKTTLIQQALAGQQARPTFYAQIPDSDEAGVVSAVGDALDTFRVPQDRYPRPRNSDELARLLAALAEDGYVVVLDEFQYFSRKVFAGFCSRLQAVVDRLAARAAQVRGGWVVLGSIHAEMEAILEDRLAPLYNRVTDSIDLGHLDIASVLAVLRAHAEPTPERLLFLWTLFEGVPKYYRDGYEQGVLQSERRMLVRKIFFDSSAPLRSEADNWFLRELGGKVDTVLKFVARRPGTGHKELVQAIRDKSGEDVKNVGTYLATLTDRYRLVERKLPISAPDDARRGRYYVTDNYLRAWLAALAGPVSARGFRPADQLVAEADEALQAAEGVALEKLVGQLYEERSRRAVGDFPLTERVRGYWDRKGTEIDLVALNADKCRIRFGSCKRSAKQLLKDIGNFKGHVGRFLNEHRAYHDWAVELVGVSVRLTEDDRAVMARNDIHPQSLDDLTDGLG